ncbi:hypothetical protein RI367_001181 [Sorochytrium milnesiophthora]
MASTPAEEPILFPHQRRTLTENEKEFFQQEGYAKGCVQYVDAPHPVEGLKKPSTLHGKIEHIVGTIESTAGKLLKKPIMQAKGEEKKAMAIAEMERAAAGRHRTDSGLLNAEEHEPLVKHDEFLTPTAVVATATADDDASTRSLAGSIKEPTAV